MCADMITFSKTAKILICSNLKNDNRDDIVQPIQSKIARKTYKNKLQKPFCYVTRFFHDIFMLLRGGAAQWCDSPPAIARKTMQK